MKRLWGRNRVVEIGAILGMAGSLLAGGCATHRGTSAGAPADPLGRFEKSGEGTDTGAVLAGKGVTEGRLGGDAGRARELAPPPPGTGALEPLGDAPAILGAGRPIEGLERIYFGFDQYGLTAEARETLVRNAAHLHGVPVQRVVVEGHCDERGTSEYNLALGEQRARSAVQYLADLGVARDRLHPLTRGKEIPLDEGRNEAAWARNRRAEFLAANR